MATTHVTDEKRSVAGKSEERTFGQGEQEVEEYESYSTTCKVYDQRRTAIGMKYIVDAMKTVRRFFGGDFFSFSSARSFLAPLIPSSSLAGS